MLETPPTTEHAGSPTSRIAPDPAAVILLLSCVALAALAWRFAREYHFNVVDDAYISFQYAKNWALGAGLTFNPGERVEGYTNFLWVAMLTPLVWISRALALDFTMLAIGLNVALAVLGLVLVARIARHVFEGRWLPAAVAVLILALDNAYQVYAMSGLENSLLSVCLLAALLAFVRGRPALLGLFLALAAMTRPDALLYAAICGAVCMAALVPGARVLVPETPFTTPRPALRALAVLAAVFGAYFAARFAYYGELVPNTFHVKAGRNLDAWARGWEYTRGFGAQRLYLPVVALAAPFVARRAWTAWLGAYVLLHAVYVTYVGGDFYQGFRFYVSLLPLLALLIAAVADVAYRSLADRRVRAGALAGGVALAAAFTWRGFIDGPYRGEIVRWGSTVDANVRYMKWLGTRFPPGTSMVVGDIGAAGFFADLRVIDVYGIVDPVVAKQEVPRFGQGKPGHEKVASPSYLLSKDPDLVKWGYVHGDLRRRGYYILTDFPADLDVQGLWVKDDLPRRGRRVGTALSFDDAQGWELGGDASAFLPARGSRRGQTAVIGATGAFVNTFTPEQGDGSTGKLLSPEFTLEGTHVVLGVGGGRDAERLRVALVVDGQVVRSATGHGAEVIGRREWDVTPWRGRPARLEITDEATGPWGHLLVDEVELWELAGQAR